MLQLIINSKPVKFSGKVNFKCNSPLLSEVATYTNNFKLPFCPENDEFFGFIRYIETSSINYKFENVVFESSFTTKKGCLTIKGIDDDGYIGNFISYSKRDEIVKFNLKNIIKSYTTDNQEENIINSLSGNSDYVFCTVHNPNISSKLFKNECYVNEFPTRFVNYFRDGFTIMDASNSTGMYGYESYAIPFFYLRAVFNAIFKQFQINYKNNILESDADFRQMLLFNNISINQYRINGMDGGIPIQTITRGKQTIFKLDTSTWPNNLVVGNYVLFSYSGSAGLTFNGNTLDWITYRVAHKVVEVNGSTIKVDIDTTNYTDYTGDPSSPNYITCGLGNIFINFCNTINLQKHVPEMTFGDFIKELESLLFIKFIFDESSNYVSIVKLNDVITSARMEDISQYCLEHLNISNSNKSGFILNVNDSDPLSTSLFKDPEKYNQIEPVASVANLSTSAKSNDICYVIDEDSWYIFGTDENNFFTLDSWNFLTRNFFNKKTGDGELNISSQASPMAPVDLPGIYDNISGCGFGSDVGYYTPYIQSLKNNAIKLFFYRGLINNINWANVDEKDYNGTKISSANLSLLFNGPYGIYEKLGKNWLNFLLNIRKDAEKTIIWPAYLLANFDWCLKYTIDYTSYLVVSFEYESDEQENIEWGVTELAKC